MNKNKTEVGTIRIKSKKSVPVIKTAHSWKKIDINMRNINPLIGLFKSHHNFNILIDSKNPSFLKGEITPQHTIQGERIKKLPDGTILDKAYSLFSPQLTIHDESSHDHWNVLYQNSSGSFTYLYSKKKLVKQKNKKYQKVKEFKKQYSKLKKNVQEALNDYEDEMAIPMFTLLITCMRIGNEIYFRTNGHKGLATLQKKRCKNTSR